MWVWLISSRYKVDNVYVYCFTKYGKIYARSIDRSLWSIGGQTHNVTIHFLLLYSIKHSILPCVWSVIDHRQRQNVVRTSVIHSTDSSSAIFSFCSYHILTSSVIYYWTDRWHHGIYLSKRGQKNIWSKPGEEKVRMREFVKMARLLKEFTPKSTNLWQAGRNQSLCMRTFATWKTE